MGDDMLTKRQAAHWLGVSVPTVGRLLASGELRGHRVGLRLVRIPKSAIVDYLNRHCTGKGVGNADR